MRKVKSSVGFVGAATVALLALTGETAHAQEACEGDVPDDAIQIYDQTNYGGDCLQLRQNISPHTGYWGLWLFGWNDRIQSVKVGADVRVKMFLDGGFSGKRFYTYSSDPNLVPFNREYSSLRIEENGIGEDCGELFEGEVAFYTDSDFGGDCWVWNAEAHEGAGFTHVFETGIENDTISSVRNNSRFRIFMAHDYNNTGGHHENSFPYTSRNISAFSNDQITDLIVQP
jgi:hypothetical protein